MENIDCSHKDDDEWADSLSMAMAEDDRGGECVDTGKFSMPKGYENDRLRDFDGGDGFSV